MLLWRLSGCDIVSYLFSYAGDQQASMDQPAASIAGRGEEEQQIALVPPTALIEDPRSLETFSLQLPRISRK